MTLRVCPKAVGIAGAGLEIAVQTAAAVETLDLQILSVPEFLRAGGEGARAPRRRFLNAETAEWRLSLEALAPGRGIVVLSAGGREFRVPAVVFRSREFFLCMVVSSNHHTGFDPELNLFGGTPEDLDVSGDGWRKTRQLEVMYHQRGLPITWLIDEKVAAKAAPKLREWHETYGDDIGVMPSSGIHFNAENYNTGKGIDELAEIARHTRDGVLEHFDFYTTTFAVDQFIGSIGGSFTEAARRLGFRGLWGVGFDHRTCDTSMFHRGCPWDMYKPHNKNFRIPAGHEANVWMYQWTTRDALLSLHSPDSGPSGAVIFSTDPDDVRNSRIFHHQIDYWERFFRGYRRNFPPQDSDPSEPPAGLNDSFVFLMHQEDHDCHHPEDADQLRAFLDATGGEATPATMEEITEWLNQRYSVREQPAQLLYLEDHLRCHDDVVWYAGVRKPADWPTGGDTYPPAIVFYDADAMWCASEGETLPWRWFDYTQRLEQGEEDAYPEEDLRRLVLIRGLDVDREENTLRVRVTFYAERFLTRVPLVLWHVLRREEARDIPRRNEFAAVVRDNVIVTLDAAEGENEARFEIDLAPLL